MTEAEAEALAHILWNYHLLHQPLKRCDAILALGSVDTKVAARAAELLLQGYGKYLIISGGLGRRSKQLFGKPEAEVFAGIARAKGVPANKIIIENKATNTGENIRFTYDLLQRKGLKPTSLLLVQKPYMERRTYATFKKQWPDPRTDFTVTSPQISYRQYTHDAPRNELISLLVGDVHRIMEYPKLGYQIAQPVPPEVQQAYDALITAGYTEHLPKS